MPVIHSFTVGLAIMLLIPGQIDRDEEVEFNGSYLYWNDSGELVLVIRGRLVEPERRGIGRRLLVDRLISPALYRYIGKGREEFDESARARMVDRLVPFLADGESAARLRMRIVGRDGVAELALPKTSAGGQFSLATIVVGEVLVASLAQPGSELKLEPVLPAGDARDFSVRLRVPPRELKWLVISDIDDTVRIADVLDRAALIERTFFRPYESVPGMSPLYNRLARLGAEFHFVSGSPWQLNRVIERFLAAESFPPAVLHCRELSWDFWNADPIDTLEFKVATIEKLLKQFSTGQVVLIGDDGEHDPEVYSKICERYADRVAAVWIRHVRSEPTGDRLAGPRSRLGADRAIIFDDPIAVEQSVSRFE